MSDAYTDAEIEALARWHHETHVGGKAWSDTGDDWRALMRHTIHDSLAGLPGPTGDSIRAAARLMRDAYERGAADMRERAAVCARMAKETSKRRVHILERVAEEIRALPLAKDPQ